MVKLCSTVEEIRAFLQAGKGSVGFVPTMGALHAGHLSLVRVAQAECDRVVVSIFVNPTQFGVGEGFEAYPRDLERDVALLRELGVDAVFVPNVEEIYPENADVSVCDLGELGRVLCAVSRPHHFPGVAQVVKRLFDIIQPDRAYFGQKDYQQTLVVKRLVQELDLPIEVVVVPTMRESDGLAMSSRNVYLSGEERRAALVLYRTLCAVRDAVREGEQRVGILEWMMRQMIEEELLARLDYAEIRDAKTLERIEVVDGSSFVAVRPVVVAVAVFFGKTRLIDNMLL